LKLDKCEIASNAGTEDVLPHLQYTAILLLMNYINGFHSRSFCVLNVSCLLGCCWIIMVFYVFYLQLVLSACSSYFETVLSLYEHQSPIIILKDVAFDDMSALIRFMYAGEITIEQVGAWSSLVDGF